MSVRDYERGRAAGIHELARALERYGEPRRDDSTGTTQARASFATMLPSALREAIAELFSPKDAA